MNQDSTMKRRHFVLTLTAAVTGTGLRSLGGTRAPGIQEPDSIQDVIDLIIQATPGGYKEKTVDTVKSGDPSQRVRGIATTFLATYEVIEKAIEKDLNFIITHEPTFYNHLDEVDWLEKSPVYQAKKSLLEKHQIVVWRFHDYWHMHSPDPMWAALVREASWSGAKNSPESAICTIPEISLGDLALHLKERLSIPTVRVVGNPGMSCRRVAIMPGAAGGRAQIGLLVENSADVLVCGEVSEWETSEYVRDAVAVGRNLGLIVTGHVVSEEFGMKLLVEWLSQRISGVPIQHIAAQDPFQYL